MARLTPQRARPRAWSRPAPATMRRASRWRRRGSGSTRHRLHAPRRGAAEGGGHERLRSPGGTGRGHRGRRARRGPGIRGADGGGADPPVRRPRHRAGPGSGRPGNPGAGARGAARSSCPAGGGGLVAGVAAAVHASRLPMRGGRSAGGGRGRVPASLAAGRPARLASMATMADGIAVACPGAYPVLADHRSWACRCSPSQEESIARALLLLMERSKQVVEPAGGGRGRRRCWRAIRRAGAAGRGGAVRRQHRSRWSCCESCATDWRPSGRYLSVTVRLAGPAGVAGGAARPCWPSVGANVLDVDHVWTDPALVMGQVEVLIQAETRGPDAPPRGAAAPAGAGYRAGRSDVSCRTSARRPAGSGRSPAG